MNSAPNLSNATVAQRQQQMDDFDQRAMANSANVTQIHEFRRQNIKDYEAPQDNLFDYSTEENDVKYNALKVENILRFNNTFKAIRWGIFVGGLFGMHRYYRSRDIQNSLTWFCTVSSVSFFNIWISYGLQEFVTQHGTTKSMQMAARNEYHTNAYKHYIQRA